MALALVAGVPLDAVAKKNFVAGTVGGEAKKWKGRYAILTLGAAGGVFIVATKRARPGKILPTIGIACGGINLMTATLPTTATLGCSASYMEQRIGGNFETHGWLSYPEGVSVTFESFDGARLRGSATGVLDPLYAGDGQIDMDVTFSGKVVFDDN